MCDCRDFLTCHLAYNEFMRNNYGQINLPPHRYKKALYVFELEKKMEKDLKNRRLEEQKQRDIEE